MSVSFREALQQEYAAVKSRGERPAPFAFYCGLSDRIGSDYTLRKRAELFFEVDKAVGLIDLYLKFDPAVATEKAKRAYPAAASLLSSAAYDALLNVLVGCASSKPQPPQANLPAPRVAAVVKAKPENHLTPAPMKTATPARPPVPQAKQAPAKPIVAAKAAVKRAPVQPPPAAPAHRQKQTPPPKRARPVWRVIRFFLIIVCAAFVLRLLSWTGLQWIVGIGGSIIVNALAFGIAWLIDEKTLIDEEYVPLFLFPVLMLVNFFLLRTIGADYRVIFGCFSVIQATCYLIVSIVSFSDEIPLLGWGYLAELAATLTVMRVCL